MAMHLPSPLPPFISAVTSWPIAIAIDGLPEGSNTAVYVTVIHSAGQSFLL